MADLPALPGSVAVLAPLPGPYGRPACSPRPDGRPACSPGPDGRPACSPGPDGRPACSPWPGRREGLGGRAGDDAELLRSPELHAEEHAVRPGRLQVAEGPDQMPEVGELKESRLRR